MTQNSRIKLQRAPKCRPDLGPMTPQENPRTATTRDDVPTAAQKSPQAAGTPGKRDKNRAKGDEVSNRKKKQTKGDAQLTPKESSESAESCCNRAPGPSGTSGKKSGCKGTAPSPTAIGQAFSGSVNFQRQHSDQQQDVQRPQKRRVHTFSRDSEPGGSRSARRQSRLRLTEIERNLETEETERPRETRRKEKRKGNAEASRARGKGGEWQRGGITRNWSTDFGSSASPSPARKKGASIHPASAPPSSSPSLSLSLGSLPECMKERPKAPSKPPPPPQKAQRRRDKNGQFASSKPTGQPRPPQTSQQPQQPQTSDGKKGSETGKRQSPPRTSKRKAERKRKDKPTPPASPHKSAESSTPPSSDPSASLDIYTCCCGKRFRSEKEMGTHASHAAHSDEAAGNWERALEHAKIRLALDFSNITTAQKLEELKRRVKERMKEPPQAPVGEPQHVFTDGSGAYDPEGVFKCGLGIRVVDGPSLALALPGTDQTVQRAELMAILIALLVTDPSRPTAIYTDSLTAFNWFTRLRLAHADQLLNDARPNGDILRLIVQAAAGRGVSMRKVKAHQDVQTFEALLNNEADRLANEGREENKDPYIAMGDWLKAHGFQVPERVVVEEPKEVGERERVMVRYNVMVCEICGLTLLSTPKKRNHVLHAHPSYLQEEHARYSANPRPWRKAAGKLNLDPTAPRIEPREDSTLCEEEEPLLKAKPRLPLLFEGELKDQALAEMVSRLTEGAAQMPWVEHTRLLSSLCSTIYDAVLLKNKVALQELEDRKRRKEGALPAKPTIQGEEKAVPREVISEKDLRRQQMAARVKQLGEMIAKARADFEGAGPEDKTPARQTLRKLTSLRNKLEKRMTSSEFRSRVTKRYIKNPQAALRMIFGEQNPECRLPLKEIEAHFEALFEEKSLDEAQRPAWMDDSLFRPLKEDSIRALSCSVTPEEVQETLASLSAGSAPGTDGLTYEVWARVPRHPNLLAALFNAWLAVGEIPRALCTCKTVLLYKKGDALAVQNWRPISLQASLTKILMKLLQRRLLAALARDEILSRMQKGFVNMDGCLEHVQLLTMACNDARRNATSIFGVFYDLKNAFGSIPQALIFQTLERHRVPAPLISVIKSYYQRDRTVVVNGSAQTKVLRQRVGVKQGCPLSPLLFILCIDPVLRHLESLGEGYAPKDKPGTEEGLTYSGSAFADDIVLLSRSEEGLRKMHETLLSFLGYIKVSLGVEKSATFGTSFKRMKKSDAPPALEVGGQTLQQLKDREVYDYLGVSIAPNTGRQVKRRRCRERVEDALQRISKLGEAGLLPWQLQDALKTYILPRLVYSMTQLEAQRGEMDQVDKAVRRVLKASLDLPPSAPSAFFHASPAVGGLGMPEVVEERRIFTVTTWTKLLTSEDALVRGMAWREIEELKNDGKIACYQGAETRTNSARCPHFLDWQTDSQGKVATTVKGIANARVANLTRSLASLGCQLKKDREGNLVLYSGSMPIQEDTSRTLRGIYRERLASQWLHTTTGTHIGLAQKAHLGNWWIANPRYLSASDYRFACRVRVNCLPVQANVAKWTHGGSPLCPLCRQHKGTQKHMLCGCERLLPRYTERHNRIVNELERALKRKHVVLKERAIKGQLLRPDLTIPEGAQRGIYLDVAVTGGETPDGGMMKTIREKGRKYLGQRGIRLESNGEALSKETFRFIPVVLTPTGLYRPGLYFDLRNIAGLSKKATTTLLKRLSALAIRESRLIWHDRKH